MRTHGAWGRLHGEVRTAPIGSPAAYGRRRTGTCWPTGGRPADWTGAIREMSEDLPELASPRFTTEEGRGEHAEELTRPVRPGGCPSTPRRRCTGWPSGTVTPTVMSRRRVTCWSRPQTEASALLR